MIIDYYTSYGMHEYDHNAVLYSYNNGNPKCGGYISGVSNGIYVKKSGNLYAVSTHSGYTQVYQIKVKSNGTVVNKKIVAQNDTRDRLWDKWSSYSQPTFHSVSNTSYLK